MDENLEDIAIVMAEDGDLRFAIGDDDEVENREREMDDDEDEEAVFEGEEISHPKLAMRAIRNENVPRIPHIYGIDRDCCGTKKNTEDRFRTISKYWMVYVHNCEGNDVPFLEKFGLGLYNPNVFSEQGGFDSQYDHDRVRKFFLFLKEAGVSASQMDKAKQFVNSHMRCEFKNRLIAAGNLTPRLGKAKVGEAVEVAGVISVVRGEKARKDMDDCIDLHAEVDNFIEKKQDRQMLELAMYAGANCDGKVQNIKSLSKLEFAASYNSSKQNLRRGEEHYSQRLVQRFVRRIEGIGPTPGMLCVHIVTNESKRNKSGHFQYTAFARHIDPQQDTAAYHGILLLHRLCKCNHHIEDFFDYQNLYKVATYPSIHSGIFLPDTRDQARRHYASCWEPFFFDAGVNALKLTHQPRVQGAQDCDRKGCTATEISRMHGHQVATADQSKAGRESYMKNPPTPCLVALAGGNPKEPVQHSPSWASIFPSNDLIGQIPEVAYLILQHEEAITRFNNCTTVDERRDQRLYTIKGTLECMLFEIKCAFQLFASRPVDPETQILQADRPSFYERFKNGTLRQLFGMAIFQSEQYANFQNLVYQAEKEQHDYNTILSKPAPAAFMAAINDRLVPAMGIMHNGWQNGISRLEEKFEQERMANQHFRNFIVQRLIAAFPNENGVSFPYWDGAPFASIRNENSHMAATVPDAARIAPIPLKEPAPAENDVLAKGGGPRKKRKAVSEEDRLRAEEFTGIPRPSFADSDNSCQTLSAYWRIYKEKWGPLEEKYGPAWRTDLPVLTANGTLKKVSNSRSRWWSLRKGMYDTVLFYKRQFKAENPELTDEAAEGMAVEEGEKIFDTVPVASNGRRKLEDINKVFREVLRQRGQHSSRGRPRKDHESVPNHARLDAFGTTFHGIEIDEAAVDMNVTANDGAAV